MNHRELQRVDGQWVRLTHCDGLIFEGLCRLDDAEYCFHEYGRNEDALNIDNWLFYRGDILEAEAVEPKEVGLWMSRPLHRMHLDPDAFAAVDTGKKTIELRLYDEKRRRVQAGALPFWKPSMRNWIWSSASPKGSPLWTWSVSKTTCEEKGPV